MFCTNCGKVIDDDAIHCVHCGAKVGEEPVAEQPQPQPQTIYIQQPQPIYVMPQQPVQEKPKENILAILALIASCLGIVTGVGFIVGIVLGFLGLKEAKKTGNGKGMSKAGIIIGFVGIGIVVLTTVVSLLITLLPYIIYLAIYVFALLGFAMETASVYMPIL